VLEVTALSARCLVLTLGGDGISTSYGANCLAVHGRDGTLLVDPLVAPAHARLVEAALQERGWPAVSHVVLTHHHTDHALGAGWFATRGATVACQQGCATAMAAQHGDAVARRRREPALRGLFDDAAPYLPAVRFEAGWSVDLGGLGVEAHHVGPAHTDGDAAVLVPSEGVSAGGDVVFAGYHYNYEEATLERLPAALARVRALGAAYVVPGHGPVGGPELLDEQARYHEAVRRLVRGAATPAAAAAAVLAAYPRHRYPAGAASAVARLWRGGASCA
jgi:cyclase